MIPANDPHPHPWAIGREPGADLVQADDLGDGEDYHRTRPFEMLLLAIAVAEALGWLRGVGKVCLYGTLLLVASWVGIALAWADGLIGPVRS